MLAASRARTLTTYLATRSAALERANCWYSVRFCRRRLNAFMTRNCWSLTRRSSRAETPRSLALSPGAGDDAVACWCATMAFDAATTGGTRDYQPRPLHTRHFCRSRFTPSSIYFLHRDRTKKDQEYRQIKGIIPAEIAASTRRGRHCGRRHHRCQLHHRLPPRQDLQIAGRAHCRV